MTLNYVSPEDMDPIEEGAAKKARKAKAAAKKAKALKKIAQRGVGSVTVKGVEIDATAAKELEQAVSDRQALGSGDKKNTLDILAQARKSAQVGKRAAKKAAGGVSVSTNRSIQSTTAAERATPGSKARVRITGAKNIDKSGMMKAANAPKVQSSLKTMTTNRAGLKDALRAAAQGRTDSKKSRMSKVTGAVDTVAAGGLKAVGKTISKVSGALSKVVPAPKQKSLVPQAGGEGGLSQKQSSAIRASSSKPQERDTLSPAPKTSPANLPGNAKAPANLPKTFVGKPGQKRPGKSSEGAADPEKKDAPKPPPQGNPPKKEKPKPKPKSYAAVITGKGESMEQIIARQILALKEG